MYGPHFKLHLNNLFQMSYALPENAIPTYSKLMIIVDFNLRINDEIQPWTLIIIVTPLTYNNMWILVLILLKLFRLDLSRIMVFKSLTASKDHFIRPTCCKGCYHDSANDSRVTVQKERLTAITVVTNKVMWFSKHCEG